MNFSNNSLVRLTSEFINICKAETISTVPVPYGLVTSATYVPKQELADFLLTIPFAPYYAHMEV
jgi:hypothetical protein